MSELLNRLSSRPYAAFGLLFVAIVIGNATQLSAQTVEVGKASYRTDLPNLKDGKPRRLMKVRPMVSERIKAPVPTNDWCSSLVWPATSPHSLPMFPHPLAVQAHEKGLGLGYNPVSSVSDSFKDGKVFQRGTSYKFPYRESMVVGLKGLSSADCVLDQQSDWAVTSLWKSDVGELRATFGHGLPFVYFERKSTQPASITFTKAKTNRNQQPVDPIVFELRNITAKHTDTNGKLQLAVNAGKNVGIGSRARIRYDFDGDGKTDRVEMFALLPTDPVDASWELFSDEKQLLDENLSHGENRDFVNGAVTVEFWKCFGEGAVQLKLDQCKVELPIVNGTRFPSKSGTLTKRAQSGTVSTGDNGKSAAALVFYRDNNVLGVTVNNTHYGIFAPEGSKWQPAEKSVDEITSDLAGKDFFSVAVLPDDSKKTIQWFEKYAFSFVTDTRIEYAYQPESASVETSFSATTEPKQGNQSGTVFALYRHQHLNLNEPSRVQGFGYASPRGEMKVVSGDSFSTKTAFLGVLPALPTASQSRAALGPMVDAYLKDLTTRDKVFKSDDTYWNGKEFGKMSEVIQIANQLGKDKVCKQLVGLLERRMEDWFDAKEEHFFYYDSTWHTLIGYPDSYGSADQLNDHHFHYSYFIKAAATIAQYDPQWLKKENYGGMIDLLIRNCANYDRTDNMFPWMRFFDPYAGHSWAAGGASFASGNNQESSSESMNFATSLILYGDAIGDSRIRDLGIYWHATEAEAIRHYWFDNDGEVFPTGYGHPCVGMVWGDGASYGTWWTANPEEIHGINFLPLTGGSLYLGRNPQYVRRNYEGIVSANRNFHGAGFEGDPEKLEMWQDILLEYQALADPDKSAKRYRSAEPPIRSEHGETKVHTTQWVEALKSLGQFDEQVRADVPTAVAFMNQGKRIYVAYNAKSKPEKVTFSDGAVFEVPPGIHTFKAK